MDIIKFIIIFVILIFISNLSKANIKIRYKIDDQIITNIDILNEKNYLIFIRPSLQNLPIEEIIKISENSLIKDIIKKKEINETFKDINNEVLINKIEKKLYNFKNVKNKQQFLNSLESTNLNFDEIIDRMKYEALWNELIYQKYNSLIKINENELKNDLKIKITNNKKFEYNLSELLFDIETGDNFKKKYNEILKYISNNNFKAAASRYSISNSSSRGGEIGWVKETLLSKNLSAILNKMKKLQITEPLKYPNGYLILRINDKRDMKQIVDIDKEFKDLINYEKNKQLNQFSLLFYKKLKQNTIINEY